MPETIEMVTGKPTAFPLSVTNNGEEGLEVTFAVIETPGPDGESAGALQVVGIRPMDGVPDRDNPRKLYVPPKTTVEAEMALVSPANPGMNPAWITTGATVTAEDPITGRTQFSQDPIYVNIDNSAYARKGGSEEGFSTQSRTRGGGSGQCIPLDQFLRTNGHTDTFAEIWERTNLGQTLPEGSQYTILAPTDKAFDQLVAALNIDESILMDSPSLDLLLLHHVLPERVSVDQLAARNSVQTATCDEIDVDMRDMQVTVSDCAISASDTEVCGIDLYKINCVLPPPEMENGNDLCLPQKQQTSQGDLYSDDYEYDYDYDFELPPNFGSKSSNPNNRVAAYSGSPRDEINNRRTRFDQTDMYGGTYSQFQPLQTRVIPHRVPDKWTRLNHLANAGEEPVKATFLPPGWKEWITPGSATCPRFDPDDDTLECSGVSINGRSCAGPNMLHTCGYLESEGPKSYQIQPPPGAFRDGFITLGNTYVWQSIEGGSSYCTPATEDGSTFKGSVYHEAWVEPRGGNNNRNSKDMDLMLFLLQNPLDGSPWEVVSMQTSATPGTSRVKRLRTMGQGCFLWVVASAEGQGQYDFHLSVSERP
jgi:uncharacterized surface protein with fasciclin (FAS1) repeats